MDSLKPVAGKPRAILFLPDDILGEVPAIKVFAEKRPHRPKLPEGSMVLEWQQGAPTADYLIPHEGCLPIRRVGDNSIYRIELGHNVKAITMVEGDPGFIEDWGNHLSRFLPR